MNISTNSWHFRLAAHFSGWRGVPPNLCPYMRRVLLGLFFIALIVIASTFISCTVYTSLVIVDHYFDLSWIEPPGKELGGFFTIGILGLAASVIAGLWFGGGWLLYRIGRAYDDWRAAHPRPKKVAAEQPVKEPKPPSLLRQWFADRHDKVCRKLDFT